MAKQLVAYFSASGVTADVAARLAQAAGADLREIKPAVPYTPADLDWTDKRSRSTLEMADRASRPALAPGAPDVAGYDVVYLGFPIWWYREPSIIDTFLAANDFSGKTIVLFATSGSSGFGDTAAEVADKVAADVRIVEGPVLDAHAPRGRIEEWYEALNL